MTVVPSAKVKMPMNVHVPVAGQDVGVVMRERPADDGLDRILDGLEARLAARRPT